MADLQDVKFVIKGILGSSKKQMLQRDLVREFYGMTGYNIPFAKFGYRNYEEFLKSLTDTCILSGTGQFAQVTPILSGSAHIVKMIAKQKDSGKPRDKYKPKNQAIIIPSGGQAAAASVAAAVPFTNYNLPPRRHTAAFSNQAVLSTPPPNPHFNYNYKVPPVPLMSLNQFVLIPRLKSSMPFHHAMIRPRPPLPPPVKPPKYASPSSVQQRLQQKNVASTSQTSPGNSLNQADSQTQQEHEHDAFRGCVQQRLQQKHVESTSQTSLGNSLNQADLRIQQGHESDAISGKFNVPQIAHNNPELNYKINYKVPLVVQENLKNLVLDYPEGIWLLKLRQIYQETYNEELEFIRYGYSSLVEMCLSLNYIFRYKQVRPNDGKLYHVDVPIPESDNDPMIDLANDMQHVSVADEVSSKKTETVPIVAMSRNNPSFVMLPGDNIPVVEVPNCEQQLYIKIYVEEVYDLSKFWFSLADNEEARENLNREIESFYDVNYPKYAISQDQLEKGLFVILYKEANYYKRAVVVRFDKVMVKVFCIDFGTVETTSLENVFFMHKTFGDFPRQAIRARLARLRPPMKNCQWSRDAAYRLVELVKTKRLFASVDCTDTTQGEPIHDIILCDASQQEDIFIHDVLIAEGHAIPDTQEQTGIYGDFEPIVADLHLYPSFIELELAVVPNAMEMRVLEALKIPLPEIYPIYFKKKETPIEKVSEQGPLKQFMQRRQMLSEKEPQKVTVSTTGTKKDVEVDNKLCEKIDVGSLETSQLSPSSVLLDTSPDGTKSFISFDDLKDSQNNMFNGFSKSQSQDMFNPPMGYGNLTRMPYFDGRISNMSTAPPRLPLPTSSANGNTITDPMRNDKKIDVDVLEMQQRPTASFYNLNSLLPGGARSLATFDEKSQGDSLHGYFSSQTQDMFNSSSNFENSTRMPSLSGRMSGMLAPPPGFLLPAKSPNGNTLTEPMSNDKEIDTFYKKTDDELETQRRLIVPSYNSLSSSLSPDSARNLTTFEEGLRGGSLNGLPSLQTQGMFSSSSSFRNSTRMPSLSGRMSSMSAAPPRFPFSPPSASGPFRELPHGNTVMEQMTTQVFNTVQQQLNQQFARMHMQESMPFMGQTRSRNRNVIPTPKKYVLKIAILGQDLHIIRIMKWPCVSTWEVQYLFTGKVDPVLLRRHISMSDVVVSVLPLDGINEQFLQELTENDLISDKSRLQYTRLDCLEELISCLTNTPCEIPSFDKLVALYADSSPIWSV